jgi:hypothetical protein
LSVQKVLGRPPQAALATEVGRYEATQFLPDALRPSSKLPA